MGKPVVHFEVIGKDAEALRSFYSGLFGWEINADNPMNYGIVQREGNTRADGAGIGGGIGAAQNGESWVTFYVGTDDVAGDLAKANELGATTLMEPETIMDNIEIALFNDPEGHTVGLVNSPA